MKLIDETVYRDWRAKNTDAYSDCVFRFAEAWADEMELRMAAGAQLETIAEATMFEVDRRPGFGITGFMYGCAVQILAHCWVHGDQLRRWHNLDTQIGDEGERANRDGGVLNPALLQIGSTKGAS
jgi:hypothetical protein